MVIKVIGADAAGVLVGRVTVVIMVFPGGAVIVPTLGIKGAGVGVAGKCKKKRQGKEQKEGTDMPLFPAIHQNVSLSLCRDLS